MSESQTSKPTMKRSSDMGIRNGRNYTVYLVGLVVAAAVGFGVNYFLSVGVNSPRELEKLQGQINVLGARILAVETRQLDFKLEMDQDLATIQRGQDKNYTLLLEVQKDLRDHRIKDRKN